MDHLKILSVYLLHQKKKKEFDIFCKMFWVFCHKNVN